MTKEFIEDIRQSLIPFVKKELLEINYEGLGKSNAEEFEKDLNEVLDLASKALEQPTSNDCVSLKEVEKWLHQHITISIPSVETQMFEQLEKELPRVTPKIPTCDDCVSRKAILDAITEIDGNINMDIYTDEVRKIVKDLPPVTPTRKSGLRWIERFDNEDKWLECPHCHKDSDNAYAYCPNCGASFKEEKRGSEDGGN